MQRFYMIWPGRKLAMEDRARLFDACKHGDDVLVATLLNSRGGRDCVHQMDLYKQTPLFKAVMGDHSKCIELLLKAGAAVNHSDEKQQTPLHWAAYWGATASLDLLIANGASVTAKAADGRTALHDAARHGRLECCEHLTQCKDIQINARDRSLQTPFLKATLADKVSVLRMLSIRGADVRLGDFHGRTPLHRAASLGFLEIVRFLLEEGANPNRRDKAGRTPWQEASRHGHKLVCEALVEHGADTLQTSTDSPKPDSPQHNIASAPFIRDMNVTSSPPRPMPACNVFGLTALSPPSQTIASPLSVSSASDEIASFGLAHSPPRWGATVVAQSSATGAAPSELATVAAAVLPAVKRLPPVTSGARGGSGRLPKLGPLAVGATSPPSEVDPFGKKQLF
eukprot:TRINITY_DN9842_c0_g2_i1.p1 TRINITY_DN9842_c0_g2~~TRINITY_DN9842_c0_g2_i1.p1  ORF type:complete len:397 (-),score=84.37 TRINITY_DN9842_c0_g2_i1:232-1422(-)